jgi:hypothetical protein
VLEPSAINPGSTWNEAGVNLHRPTLPAAFDRAAAGLCSAAHGLQNQSPSGILRSLGSQESRSEQALQPMTDVPA